jgi:hypothetical protein
MLVLVISSCVILYQVMSVYYREINLYQIISGYVRLGQVNSVWVLLYYFISC